MPLSSEAADWEGILMELLHGNGLCGEVASVKIIASRGVCPGLGLPAPREAVLFAMAQGYRPPAAEAYRRGCRLHPFREGFSPPLARLKSLNYLYFLAARQAAADEGADEAIISDPHGMITETSAGSILARTEGQWWTPSSPYQLPGITLQSVSRLLGESGERVDRRPATLEDLLGAQTVWAMNSLMLIMPVCQIATHQVPAPQPEEARRLNTLLTACASKNPVAS